MILILLALTSFLAYGKCPIEDFVNPVQDSKARFSYTPQESYHGIESLHGALDIIAPQGTNVYAVADGVLSVFYPYGKREKEYFDTLKLDHGNGLVSVYTHIQQRGIPSEILSAIKEKRIVKRGEAIAEINGGSGSILPHLHYILLNERTSEYINPLNCYHYEDKLIPEISDLLLSIENKKPDTPYSSHMMFATQVIRPMYKDFFKHSQDVEELVNRNYDLFLTAYDKNSFQERSFHIHKLDMNVFFEAEDGVKEKVLSREVFDASSISCGYNCIVENLWKGSFIKKDNTPFRTYPFSSNLSLFEGNFYSGFPYRIMPQNQKGYESFNPCYYSKAKKWKTIHFVFMAADAKNNQSQKSFSFDFDSSSCL